MNLTDAQRRALLWLPKDGGWRKHDAWPGMFWIMRDLQRSGHVRMAELGFSLTPAGIAAREELEKREGVE